MFQPMVSRPSGHVSSALVAKIMNARPTPMSAWVEANGLQQTTIDPTDGRLIETSPANGDEQELVLGGDSPAMLEIAVQASDCRLVNPSVA